MNLALIIITTTTTYFYMKSINGGKMEKLKMKMSILPTGNMFFFFQQKTGNMFVRESSSKLILNLLSGWDTLVFVYIQHLGLFDISYRLSIQEIFFSNLLTHYKILLCTYKKSHFNYFAINLFIFFFLKKKITN